MKRGNWTLTYYTMRQRAVAETTVTYATFILQLTLEKKKITVIVTLHYNYTYLCASFVFQCCYINAIDIICFSVDNLICVHNY